MENVEWRIMITFFNGTFLKGYHNSTFSILHSTLSYPFYIINRIISFLLPEVLTAHAKAKVAPLPYVAPIQSDWL